MKTFTVFYTDAKGANAGRILLEAHSPDMARQRFASMKEFAGQRITKVKLSRAADTSPLTA